MNGDQAPMNTDRLTLLYKGHVWPIALPPMIRVRYVLNRCKNPLGGKKYVCCKKTPLSSLGGKKSWSSGFTSLPFLLSVRFNDP